MGWRRRLRAPNATFWLLVAFTVLARLPGINRPLLGNFATKNCVYGMIARNWATGRAPWYRPTVDQLVGGRRGWHLTELPVPVFLPAASWALLGGSLDAWGRAASIAWSAAGVACLYLWMWRRHGGVAALAGGAALALSPISVVYGQSFMLEPAVAALSIFCIWANEEWWRSKGVRWLCLLAAALGVLLLTKPYMLLLLGVLAAEAWRARRVARQGPAAASGDSAVEVRNAMRCWRRMLAPWTLATLVAAIPAVAWCAGVWHVSDPANPRSAHVYFSLRRAAADHQQSQTALLERRFYLRAARNLAGPVLTPLGGMLCVLAFFGRGWKAHAPWLAACVLLVVALPLKFQSLTYYYLVVLPPLCALVGLGFENLYARLRQASVVLRRCVLAGTVLLLPLFYIRFAWRPGFVTPNEDRMVPAAAAAMRALSHPSDRVLTLHGSTLSLLYYCDREGWAINAHSPRFEERWMEALIGGVRWVVATQSECLAQMPRVHAALSSLRPVCEGDGYCIYAVEPAADLASRTNPEDGVPHAARLPGPAAGGCSR
jgi:hypothetical protein